MTPTDLLADLQRNNATEWTAVAEIFRRQWVALSRRGLIEYRTGSRQHEARLTAAGAKHQAKAGE